METTQKLKMVVGFMFNENETDVLLIEKNRPAWQLGKLNGIGGKVSGWVPRIETETEIIKGHRESSYEAMCREFKEECGIEYGGWMPVILLSGEDWEVQVFTGKSDKVFDYKQMEEEKVLLILINELDSYEHISNLRWLIPMCLDVNNINYKIEN